MLSIVADPLTEPVELGFELLVVGTELVVTGSEELWPASLEEDCTKELPLAFSLEED